MQLLKKITLVEYAFIRFTCKWPYIFSWTILPLPLPLPLPPNWSISYLNRSSGPEVFYRPASLLKKRLWHRCFPVNFVKFLRTPFLQNTSGGDSVDIVVKYSQNPLFLTFFERLHSQRIFFQYFFSRWLLVNDSRNKRDFAFLPCSIGFDLKQLIVICFS